ncbi:hypothetical protein DSL92_01015 [Billgrantia gudaonensis]|uniref:Uncharacterized protein n=1 Tax=Billgrantia gudaonensis TaxID=376427 RepID=A0A3S0NHS2_9GAMM|nr:hypothetical protein DSL92_01015 [Halomonas gudaonensis]
MIAELDIHPDLWFFEPLPRRPGDARLPGFDAMWQLVGFYLGWLGHPGRGRAFGLRRGQVHRPDPPEPKRSHIISTSSASSHGA